MTGVDGTLAPPQRVGMRRGVRRGIDRRDILILLGLLALAALLRLTDLATRGTWDGDQGHDMLVLRALVRDGVVPLLGPPTSIGEFHHGALYYYLLAPAAALTGGDSPLAVVGVIALAGIAAVGVTWWLARAIGGPIAGLVAGLAMAVSTAAVEESTFIWNPNLIALSSSVALAGAWRAWSTRRASWWIVAAVGTAVTMQCHVLGMALVPVVGALLVADLRRRDAGAERRPVVLAALAGSAILLVAYVPLAIHELTTDFSELRAALEYLAGGRGAGGPALPIRFAIAGIRVVSWPLVGLITTGFAPAVISTAVVAAIVAWRWRSSDPGERVAVRWLGTGLLWSTAFLTLAAPSLASVVSGLPNDHYHAFADPMVFVLVGLGVAAAVRMASPGSAPAPASGATAPADGTPSAPRRHDRRIGVVVALGAFALLLGWNLTHQPPRVHPDGGFPAGQDAGDRVDAALSAAGIGRDQPALLRSLPNFKSTEAVAYPLVRLGRSVIAETPIGVAPGSAPSDGTAPTSRPLVLLCDQLFADVLGADCGGAAEASVTADAGGPGSGPAGDPRGWGPLLERIEAAPGRFVSVYLPAVGG